MASQLWGSVATPTCSAQCRAGVLVRICKSRPCVNAWRAHRAPRAHRLRCLSLLGHPDGVPGARAARLPLKPARSTWEKHGHLRLAMIRLFCMFFFYIWSMPICEPWCWYIYLQNWMIFTANVGKYSSTMEHMGNVFHYIYGELLECDS